MHVSVPDSDPNQQDGEQAETKNRKRVSLMNRMKSWRKKSLMMKN